MMGRTKNLLEGESAVFPLGDFQYKKEPRLQWNPRKVTGFDYFRTNIYTNEREILSEKAYLVASKHYINNL